MLVSYLSPALPAPELSAFFVAEVEVAADDALVELRAAHVAHAGEGFGVGVVFDEAESAGCSVQRGVVRRSGEGRGLCAYRVFLSRPMMIRLMPPPSSGLVHFVNNSYTLECRRENLQNSCVSSDRLTVCWEKGRKRARQIFSFLRHQTRWWWQTTANNSAYLPSFLKVDGENDVSVLPYSYNERSEGCRDSC